MGILSKVRDWYRSRTGPKLPEPELFLPDAEALERLRNKPVLTQREDMLLHYAAQAEGPPIEYEAEHAEVKEDGNGTQYIALPDSRRHEARLMPATKGIYDRLFWTNLIISCDGPDRVVTQAQDEPLLTRNFGKLEYAEHDLRAFYDYYRPMLVGSPGLVGQDGMGKSPGFFDCTKRLSNPNEQDIDEAISQLREWLAINIEDPEFVSLQINLMFAGHGELSGERSGLVIADGALASARIAKKLRSILDGFRQIESPCRLDLYLDCCHSAAIARDIAATIFKPESGYTGPRLGFGKIYCSCLDDELCLEHEKLRHGLFSFAFLNEMSRRIPDGADDVNLGVRDVGWFSNLAQHPLQLDFTHPKRSPDDHAPMFRYPCLALLPKSEAGEVFGRAQEAAYDAIEARIEPVDGEVVMNPVEVAVEVGRHVRAACKTTEAEIAKRPAIRKVFSRQEVVNRTFFWG